MAQVRWWLWGLIPLAILWLVAILFETGAVETDLVNRTGVALSAGHWIPAPLVVRGRDMAFGGEAYSAGDRAAARSTADAVSGVRRVVDASQLAPSAVPYSWSATKAQTAVALAGHVPNPQDRAKILGVAAGAAGKVADSMLYARGAPPAFTEAVTGLVPTLEDLTEGTVALDGQAVTIKGIARDANARAAIDAGLAKLPTGFTVLEKDIKVPAYTFEAVKHAAASDVTLSGTLPDTASRESILAAARAMFVGQSLVDRTKLQAGAPDGFGMVVATGLEQLSRLDNGTLKIAEHDVDLSGTALYDRAVGQIKETLAALPAGYTAKASLKGQPPASPIDAQSCQLRFNDLLAKGTVRFETGSAKIDKVSAGILDHLVAIAQQCPSQSLEISGHTDASGNDAFNMDLSKQRAQAVVDYLAAAGLDAGHLTAVGFGKTKPIASNDTEDGRAKNRRIEFQVK